MEEIFFEYTDRPYKEELLSLLEGRIFHVTSRTNFKSILLDGCICHNSQKRFEPNPGSSGPHDCYAIIKGYVCLFDLRGVSEKVIGETLSKYYFCAPSWFSNNSQHRDLYELSFLIYNEEYEKNLIPNLSAPQYRDENNLCYVQYIPVTECWFPDNLPLTYIKSVIHVTISEPDSTAKMASSMSAEGKEQLDRLLRLAGVPIDAESEKGDIFFREDQTPRFAQPG